MSDVDPAESTSLSEHESAYVSPEAPASAIPDAAPAAPVAEPAPEPDEQPEPQRRDESKDGERDEHGRFKQRAESQRATSADVPKINEYTKRLRAAEEAIGVKVEKQPGESERVFQLRRRAEIAEAIRDRKAQPPPPPPVPRAPEPPSVFTEKEPQYDDFADQPDQYAAHLRAVAAFDRRKEAFEQQQTHVKTQQQQGIEERNARRDQFFKETQAQHYERMAAYHQANPHAQAILDRAGDIGLTPAMMMAIMTSDQSPELLLLVAQNEVLRDDLTDLTEGKPLNKDLVARVQRRLMRGLPDVATGSSPVPPKPVALVPRPPTPVRTGPMKAPDTPPGDDAPLSAHEAAYGSRRRR